LKDNKIGDKFLIRHRWLNIPLRYSKTGFKHTLKYKDQFWARNYQVMSSVHRRNRGNFGWPLLDNIQFSG